MASGEAEPLQYTTTVLRVSIHCEGCRKKVKKVLHSIEGVYKVTVDAAQHKVTVTGSVGADALIRRLNKAGKQAALWPAPASEAKNRPEDVTAAPPAAGEVCKDVVADKADAKPKEVAKDDEQVESEGSVKKPEKDNKGSEKKPQKDKGSGKKPEVGKRKEDGKKLNREASEAKEKKGSPELAKEAPGPAEETSGEEGSAKKGKKKNKQKDSGAEGEAVAEKPPQPPVAAPAAVAEKPPQPPVAAPAQPQLLGPERPHGGGFPYYAPLPVMSYNVTHPSASVSYYAPTPTMPMQPIPPPQVPYGYPPYPHMMPPEYMYGPPGMRSSPPQESYNDNMFNEENASSCSLM